jgi:tRNA G18 (ribose-2'-O)-methylase SpoU
MENGMSNSNKETRNIIDHYHYWKHDAILADLDSRRNNFSVLCCNLYNDFNIATVVRNSNAFLASEVLLYGSKQFDRRGTVGTHHYTRFKHLPTFDDVRKFLSRKFVVGIDNVSDAQPIEQYDWPAHEHVVMVFGQEQVGIPQDVLELCDVKLYITQYGSVRSLNVGCASSVAMYDYCSKVVSKVAS